MFKSTGNHFGGPEITFKDYQDEHEIVLNAIFEYDSTNPAYQNATELEIHVPDLSLSKSAVAEPCCVHGSRTRTPSSSRN